jgi:hypothetical protein
MRAPECKGDGFGWDNKFLTAEDPSDLQIQAAVTVAKVIFEHVPLTSDERMAAIFQTVATNSANVIIDVGAVLGDFSALEVVQIWLNEKKTEEWTAVYIHPHLHRAIEVKGDGSEVPYAFNREKVETTLVYFDHQHTVGIDVALGKNATAVTLCTCRNRLTEVAQGIYRLRDIHFGQTTVFYMVDPFPEGNPSSNPADTLFKLFKNNDDRYLRSMLKTVYLKQLQHAVARNEVKDPTKRAILYMPDVEAVCAGSGVAVNMSPDPCAQVDEQEQEQEQEQEKEKDAEKQLTYDELGEKKILPVRGIFNCFSRVGGDALGLLHHTGKPSIELLEALPGQEQTTRPSQAMRWEKLGIILSAGAMQYFAITEKRPSVPLGAFVYDSDPTKVQIALVAEKLWLDAVAPGVKGGKFFNRHTAAGDTKRPVGSVASNPSPVGLVARLLIGSPLAMDEQVLLLAGLDDTESDVLLAAVECVAFGNRIFPHLHSGLIGEWIVAQDYTKAFICRWSRTRAFEDAGRFNTDILGWPRDNVVGVGLHRFLSEKLRTQFPVDVECPRARPVPLLSPRQIAQLAGGTVATASVAALAYWAYAKRPWTGAPQKFRNALAGGVNVPQQKAIDHFLAELGNIDSQTDTTPIEPPRRFLLQSHGLNAVAWTEVDEAKDHSYIPPPILAIVRTKVEARLETVIDTVRMGLTVLAAAPLVTSAIGKINEIVQEGASKDIPNNFHILDEVGVLRSNFQINRAKITKVANTARIGAQVYSLVTPETSLMAPGVEPSGVKIRMDPKSKTYYFSLTEGEGKRFRMYPDTFFSLDTWNLTVHERGGQRRQWAFAFPLRNPVATSDVGTIRRIRTDWSKLRLGSTTVTPWTSFKPSDMFNFYLPFVIAGKTKNTRTASMWAALASRVGYQVAKRFGKESYSVEMAPDSGLSWSMVALILHTVSAFANAHLGDYLPTPKPH